jgi:hypothetical protein
MDGPKVTHDELRALQQQKWMNSQMYPEVRRYARNQILADLLVQMCHEDDMYWDLSRQLFLLFDGAITITPEQAAALEDALLEHKAKED